MRTRFGDRCECDGCDRDAKFYRVKTRRSYACEHCGFQVYPTAGTPFERTRTPLRDWFFVMFQFCASRNGVAAKEVERQLGVTYKTAWRMCHQIREYMGAIDGDEPIGGIGTAVEVDETFIGGVKRGKNMRGAAGKTVVLGMLERNGDVITRVVPNQRAVTLVPVIQANVLPGGQLHSDELRSYRGMHLRGYRHMTVNHSAKEYVGYQGASTNALEGFWASLKRGINGTHIHVSAKHLPKYLAEFEYRHNMRHVPHLMLDRLMVSFAR
jgi:transposase